MSAGEKVFGRCLEQSLTSEHDSVHRLAVMPSSWNDIELGPMNTRIVIRQFRSAATDEGLKGDEKFYSDLFQERFA